MMGVDLAGLSDIFSYRVYVENRTPSSGLHCNSPYGGVLNFKQALIPSLAAVSKPSAISCVFVAFRSIPICGDEAFFCNRENHFQSRD